ERRHRAGCAAGRLERVRQGGRRRRGAEGQDRAPRAAEGRPQRPVPVRQWQEVQEVPRPRGQRRGRLTRMAGGGDELAELYRRFPAIDAAGFGDHLEACRQAGALPESTEDLFIAWAAARGDGQAVRRIDALIAEIAPSVRRIDGTPAFV